MTPYGDRRVFERKVLARALVVAVTLLSGVLGLSTRFVDNHALFIEQSRAFAARHIADDTATRTRTSIIVSRIATGRPMPSHFLGMSLEMSHLCDFLTREQKPRTVRMLRSLGLAVLRIGGTSEDFSQWMPKKAASCGFADYVVSESLINRYAALDREFHWKTIWGLNLGANNPTLYASEASYVRSALGSNLLGIEMGNEPDWWVGVSPKLRERGFTEKTFESEWERYRQAIDQVSPGMPMVGPSTSSPTFGNDGGWYRKFIEFRRPHGLAFATEHFYPAGKSFSGIEAPTINNLLSRPLMANTAALMGNAVSIAAPKKIPTIIDEANSIISGGVKGVSDSFGASLWGLDYLFTALDRGVAGVDIHDGQGRSPYSPINLQTGTPGALYYSMLLFGMAARNATRVVPVQVNSQTNVTAHALAVGTGRLRMVAINKALYSPTTLRIRLPKRFSAAYVLRLRAPSAASTSRIALGESSVGQDGRWRLKNYIAQRVHGASFRLVLPASSAAMIEFCNSAPYWANRAK